MVKNRNGANDDAAHAVPDHGATALIVYMYRSGCCCTVLNTRTLYRLFLPRELPTKRGKQGV